MDRLPERAVKRSRQGKARELFLDDTFAGRGILPLLAEGSFR